MKHPPSKPILAGLVAIETVSAVLAWRDLTSRSEAQVRGKKDLWRLLITVYPGNSLIYWAFGRS